MLLSTFHHKLHYIFIFISGCIVCFFSYRKFDDILGCFNFILVSFFVYLILCAICHFCAFLFFLYIIETILKCPSKWKIWHCASTHTLYQLTHCSSSAHHPLSFSFNRSFYVYLCIHHRKIIILKSILFEIFEQSLSPKIKKKCVPHFHLWSKKKKNIGRITR